MKVGLLTTEFLPVWGGVAAYCINLVRALSDQVEFHVFTTSRQIDNDETLNEYSGFLDNIIIHEITPARDVFISSLRYQALLVSKLPGLIRDNKLDLIHAGGSLADQLVRVCRNSSVPHILTYHSTMWGQKTGISRSGAAFSDMDGSEKATVALYPLLYLYEYLSLKRTKNIISVSDTVKGELQNRYGYNNRISVIPNGIDTDYFTPDRKATDRKTVIFSGRLIALKGLQFLIQAIPLVLKDHKDTLFVFAGAGDKLPYVKMLTESGVPEKNYRFSYIDYRDMPEYYNSGSVMVLPSLHESFPMCILEAMACGVPVIASNVGDVHKMVKEGETGYLVEAGDYQGIARNICRILADDTLREKMGNNARTRVEQNFSIRIMGDTTMEFYKQVLESA